MTGVQTCALPIWSLKDDSSTAVLIENKIADIRYMGIRSVYRITLECGATIDVTTNHKHPTNNGVKRTDAINVGVDKMYYSADPYGNETVVSSTVISIEYIGEDEVYDVEMDDPNHTFTTGKGVVTCNSHATAYAATAYAGAYLKTKYPTAFYTVALQWADSKELPPIIAEMQTCSIAKISAPDINVSGKEFFTDFKNHLIFWSLIKIQMVGAKAVDYILRERELHGDFESLDDFLERCFPNKFLPKEEQTGERNPLNSRIVKHLIYSGCFDKVENAKSVVERYAVMVRASEKLGFEITEKEFPAEMINKHYFWSQKQISMSGVGYIDYDRVYDSLEIKQTLKKKCPYVTLKKAEEDIMDGKRGVICATVVDFEEKKYVKDNATKRMGKLTLQQNNETNTCMVWHEEYIRFQELLAQSKNKIIVFNGVIRYSDFDSRNTLQFTKQTIMTIV